MSKATVTRLFFASVLALGVGLVVCVATVVAALAGGAIHIGGPNGIHVDGGVIVGALPWLLLAGLIVAVGEVGALASWIGALMNTWQLEDKTWFLGLLVLGVFSFGWIAMAAYVLAGPDATSRGAPRPGVAASIGS